MTRRDDAFKNVIFVFIPLGFDFFYNFLLDFNEETF